MNLKEAFQYQNFLDHMRDAAIVSISDRRHAMKTERKHLRSLANSDVEDFPETVDNGVFPENDSVIRFMDFLVEQRLALGQAITKAKNALDIDIDAELNANRLRQRLIDGLQDMLNFKAVKRKEKNGVDYRFNAEGNQTRYVYDIETTETELFDREAAKQQLRAWQTKSNEVSMAVDVAMVTATVDFEPIIDVNSDFEEAMQVFLDSNKAANPAA